MKSEFLFALSDVVHVKLSGETGQVRGRAEYTDCGNQYQVDLVDAHGAYKQVWLAEDLLAEGHPTVTVRVVA